MGKYVNFIIEEKIAIVTINRPPVNALDAQVVEELKTVFEDLEKQNEARAAIITGGGDKVFVAGADIAMLTRLDRKGGEELSMKIHESFNAIEGSSLVVIAAINGLALGGGTELILACDIRIADESAKFGLPEVNLSVFPGAGGTQRLSFLVGVGKAKELIFTGDMISAEDARQIRLVEKVAPKGETLSEAKKLAQKILKKGPLAIQAAKKSINNSLYLPLKESLQQEIKLFGQLFATEDQKEGCRAFLEKRPPKFTGK